MPMMLSSAEVLEFRQALQAALWTLKVRARRARELGLSADRENQRAQVIAEMLRRFDLVARRPLDYTYH